MALNNTKKTPDFIFFLIALTVITWITGASVIQYQIESELAFESGFPGDANLWHFSGDTTNTSHTADSIVIKRVTNNESYATRKFDLPKINREKDKSLLVRGRINTLKIAPPQNIARAAAYMIWFHDDQNKTIRYITVQSLNGDAQSYDARRIVKIPEKSESFSIVLMNRDSKGEYELTSSNVSLISNTTLYNLVSPLVFISWIIAFAASAKWFFANIGYKSSLLAVSILAITIAGILLPESISQAYLVPAYKKVTSALHPTEKNTIIFYYKLWHFIVFFLIALFLSMKREKLDVTLVFIFIVLTIFAIGTEGLQLHLYHRSSRLSDIFIDISGVLLGTSLAYLYGLLRKIHQPYKS